MASMAETTELFEIGPTAQKGEHYSDISMSILFSAYASVINSERQAVWQRYNTMLFANSVFLGFLLGGGARSFSDIAIGSAFGLLLCILWLLSFESGMVLFMRLNATAARFSWEGLERERNPFVLTEAWRGNTRRRWIYRGGLFTILVFITGYVVLLLRALVR